MKIVIRVIGGVPVLRDCGAKPLVVMTSLKSTCIIKKEGKKKEKEEEEKYFARGPLTASVARRRGLWMMQIDTWPWSHLLGSRGSN